MIVRKLRCLEEFSSISHELNSVKIIHMLRKEKRNVEKQRLMVVFNNYLQKKRKPTLHYSHYTFISTATTATATTSTIPIFFLSIHTNVYICI